MTRPPFDLAAVERATLAGMRDGHRLFQTHRYAADDMAQVRLLLDVLAPPRNATILDAGCGIGEVSRLMAELRPDLFFVMSNISPQQLALCPAGARFAPVLDDCHAMCFDDGVFDAVMFSSALCQMDTSVALREARRVVKAGGALLVNDMVRDSDDGGLMEAALAARVLRPDALRAMIAAAGFDIERFETPPFDDTQFRDMLVRDGLERVLDGISAVIVRAVPRLRCEE